MRACAHAPHTFMFALYINFALFIQASIGAVDDSLIRMFNASNNEVQNAKFKLIQTCIKVIHRHLKL